VQTDLRACSNEIEALERQINVAQEKRQQAARNERAHEIEHVGKDAKAKATVLSTRLHEVYELIEKMRANLFEVDGLSISIGAANNTLEAAGRQDLMVNLVTVRRNAMAGPRATVPNRLSRKALQADKMLQSFLSLGGVLDRRTAGAMPGEPAEIKATGHHAFQRGA
jgi:hypothetical protein